MKTVFSDPNHNSNPDDGLVLFDGEAAIAVFEKLRYGERLFYMLESENESFLTLGIGLDTGCVQFTSSNDPPLFFVAVGDNSTTSNQMFYMDGSETEIDKEHCISFELLLKIAMHYIETGELLPTIKWEQV